MPKTLSTPLLLKALSKKQSAESHPTQQPTVLSTSDLTLHLTKDQEKHVNRLKLARRRKYMDEKGKELPELTEGLYRKIYGSSLRGNEEEMRAHEVEQQQHDRDNQRDHVTTAEESEELTSPETTNKENIQQSAGTQHVRQLASTKSWPQTPVPRKQIPKREIRKHLNVKPILKDTQAGVEHAAKIPSGAPMNIVLRERPVQQEEPRQRALQRREEPEPTPPAAPKNDDQLDMEYLNVMKSLEEEEMRKLSLPEDVESTPIQTRRPTVGLAQRGTTGSSPESESSDTPSMKRLYSHISDMKRYLDDLSEPEVLGAHKIKKSVNTSPDAQARTTVPVSASMPSPIGGKRISKQHLQDQSASLFSSEDATKQPFYSPMDPNTMAAEEDTLSNPSSSEVEESEKKEQLTGRAPLHMRISTSSGHILTHDEKIQVPTPSGTGGPVSDMIPYSTQPSSPPTIDPQQLLECGAPSTLHDLIFNLEMPDYSSLRHDVFLSQTASDINMESLTLSDVATHISSVCEGLQSQFYIPFVEERGRIDLQIRHSNRHPSGSISGGASLSPPQSTAAHRAASKQRRVASKSRQDNYALWNIFSTQTAQLRRRRIHEIWDIQKRMIAQFYEDNASLFQKLDHLREQIRKEQALAVRVQLRTTRAHALRLKKNNPESFASTLRNITDVTTPTIRATIRSSQSSYNITMFENQIAEIVARIFLRLLHFLTNLKKEREHALLVVDTEEYEYTGRNVLTVWKHFVGQYKGESERIRSVRNKHDGLLMRRFLVHWRRKLEDKLNDKHQKRAADTFAREQLLKKTFVSMRLAHKKMLLNSLQEQIAVRYSLSMRLLRSFFAWKSVARRGHVLKAKLMNIAFSKQEDNKLMDEEQNSQYTAMKVRVQQHLLKDIFEQHDKLKSECHQLERMDHLSLQSTASTSVAYLRQSKQVVASPQNRTDDISSRFLQRAIAVEEGSPYQLGISLDDQIDTEQLNKVQQLKREIVGIQTEIASFSRRKADASLPISLQIENDGKDNTLENIAHHSYNIKLLRGMFEKWRDTFRRQMLEHDAQGMYEYNLKRKVLEKWQAKTLQMRQDREKSEAFHRRSSITRLFLAWKRRTESLLELKDSIADQCSAHHTLRRTFHSWRCYASTSKELREREHIFTEHHRLTVLRQNFDVWHLATKHGQVKGQMNEIADRHYQFILSQRMIHHWREKNRRRQLVRRVFTRALKGYRSQSQIPEMMQNESRLKRAFKVWKSQTRVSSRIKERRMKHKIAKHWHNKKLKAKMFREWKKIYDNNSKADAFHFSLLLRRSKTMFRQWHEFTMHNSECAREEAIIRQICDRLLVKRTFYRWRRNTFAPQTASLPLYSEDLTIATKLRREPTMLVPSEDEAQLSPAAASTRPASSTDEYSPADELTLTQFQRRSLEEYRDEHEKMKRSMRERYAAKRKEFGQEVNIAQIYYHKQLKAKIFRAWKHSIHLKKEQLILQERADHFYNRKLQKTRFSNTALCTERLEKNFSQHKLPAYFEPTYRIVNYRLLLKVVQSWKNYTREQKIVRKGLAIAARFHRRRLMFKTFEKWRKKMNLMSHITRSNSAPASSAMHSQGSDETTAGQFISPLYKPTQVEMSEISLDRKLFGQNPRRPYSLVPHGRLNPDTRFESPRI